MIFYCTRMAFMRATPLCLQSLQLSSRQATEALTEFPQFLGGCIVLGLTAHFLHRAAGEVAAAQWLDALL